MIFADCGRSEEYCSITGRAPSLEKEICRNKINTKMKEQRHRKKASDPKPTDIPRETRL